jgi:transposase
MPERYGPWKTAHLRRAFDPSAYKNRNQVERGFGRRKHRRGMATRFDKLATSDQATLDLVETLDWLRSVPDSATDDPRVTP